jgi:2-oxoglutarate ferredoxin oxidoreductase subunit alpha
MSTVLAQPEIAAGSNTSPTVNDLVLKIATVNGSGSQSANLILLRSIFEMGIPVSGKNLFPSNIQGLPTWFTIRANAHGFVAQRNRVDVLIPMNAATVADDLKELHPGAIVLINESMKPFVQRDDLDVRYVPFDKLVTQVCEDTRLRKMVVNIIYVGVIAHLIGIEIEEVKRAIDHQFGKKPKAAALNTSAALAGYAWAQEHIETSKNYILRRSNDTKGKIIIEGNEAAALGCLFGGVTFLSWYPITPSSSFAETLQGYLEKYRVDPETGQRTFAVVQAEDELASISMIVGAGWAGARSATATSGPGISLMAELTGFAYFAEVPIMIVDVQRMGPSTGLPTRNSQGDIGKAYQLSHGDCKHVLLIPGCVKECYEFAAESLNLAELLQTPVFLMTDLDLGMNKWMSDPFNYPDKPVARGKVLSDDELKSNGKFARYKDVDDDGICYRTLPGTPHPGAAYFTRGTGHTEEAGYSESPKNYKRLLDRLTKKFNTARTLVPKPKIDEHAGIKIGILAYGSSDPAIREARYILEKRHNIGTNYLRLRALPLSAEVREFIARHDVVHVVEQNRDAQVAAILKDENPDLAVRLHSVLHYNGLPLDAETVVDQIAAHTSEKGNA